MRPDFNKIKARITEKLKDNPTALAKALAEFETAAYLEDTRLYLKMTKESGSQIGVAKRKNIYLEDRTIIT